MTASAALARPASKPAPTGSGASRGKVILLGEHTVVAGHPALVVTLHAGIRATVCQGVGRIEIPAWKVAAAIDDGSKIALAVQQIFAVFTDAQADSAAHPATTDVVVDAAIPPGAGLGASAALAAAIARALASRQPSRDAQATIAAAVDAAEGVFHGRPSGVDAAAVLADAGTVGIFRKAGAPEGEPTGYRPVTAARPLPLCIGFSSGRHDTAKMVAELSARLAADPRRQVVFDLLARCAAQGLSAVERGDLRALGTLFDRAHVGLHELGLSTTQLDALVRVARSAGALGAKLTGAGGGGAVIAIAPAGGAAAILTAWRRQGFTGLSTVVGEAEPQRRRRVASPPSSDPVTAWAGTNIALVKYWGKRDATLNLPAAGSLSLTLADLGTRTSVRFAAGLDTGTDRDRVVFTSDDGGAQSDPRITTRISRFLDLVRARAGFAWPAEVITHNSVPTAAGLASSASGFAALALAATRAAGLDMTPDELSALARRGSGSAARSIHGGFVEMSPGQRADGQDAFARSLHGAGDWDVRLVVAMTSSERKPIGSTEAMEHTRQTSPYQQAFITSVPADLADAKAALESRDLARLGQVAERSCLRMHAAMLAADPGIIYWNPATLEAITTVRSLRRDGLSAFFTIDAGPHVKVLCRTVDAEVVRDRLAATPGVTRTLVAAPGPGAGVRVAPPSAVGESSV